MRTVQSFSPHLPGSGPQGCLGSGLRLQPRSAPHLPRSRSQSPLCRLSSVGSAATLPMFASFGFQLILAGALSITTRPCSSQGAQKRSCLGKGTVLQSPTRPLRRPSSPSPAQAGPPHVGGPGLRPAGFRASPRTGIPPPLLTSCSSFPSPHTATDVSTFQQDSFCFILFP